ncbi:hypothetical protein [Adhaeretor mobilis]|uniref:Transposase IS30-like HTH domain-containing protein n=1 Tax=Adhaeretor mobilis TaxID=1930276 RepID=A0A517MSY1_9BACT|nr:hypothetical protein [Adhaeretor mobilis]QDS97990.1 hypothetical protein HG15A2_12600 [Adhaeretor mobilis]
MKSSDTGTENQSTIGRPRLLADPAKQKSLCSMVSVGLGIEAAARHVGCSSWTVRREAQRDPQFAQKLREARTSAQLFPLMTLRKKADTHWRAAAWLLERSCPEQFARKKPKTVSPGKVLDTLDEIVSIMAEQCDSQEQFDAMRERLETLQQERFGMCPEVTARTPKPKTEADRFSEKLKRETEELQDRPFRIAPAASPEPQTPQPNSPKPQLRQSKRRKPLAPNPRDLESLPPKITSPRQTSWRHAAARFDESASQRAAGNPVVRELYGIMEEICLAKARELESPPRASDTTKPGVIQESRPQPPGTFAHRNTDSEQKSP